MYAILNTYANLFNDITTSRLDSRDASILDEAKNNALIFMKKQAEETGALLWRKIFLNKDGDSDNALKVYELMYSGIHKLIKNGHASARKYDSYIKIQEFLYKNVLDADSIVHWIKYLSRPYWK